VQRATKLLELLHNQKKRKPTRGKWSQPEEKGARERKREPTRRK
jgi:hypothetical protein